MSLLLTERSSSLIFSILQDSVTLWWPNGYGEQKLYPLHFSLKTWLNRTGSSLRARTSSTKNIRVGFRTIELVEDAAREGKANFLIL